MSETRKRIPELDGLRVLMIFIVSWYHIWQQSWLRPVVGSYSLDYLVRSGYIWVDGTVLLSSFLLFLPYARAMRDRDSAENHLSGSFSPFYHGSRPFGKSRRHSRPRKRSQEPARTAAGKGVSPRLPLRSGLNA